MLSRLTSLARSPAPAPIPATAPQGAPQIDGPKLRPGSLSSSSGCTPRRKSPPPFRRALLGLIREQCPDAVGMWIVPEELARAYIELASREGWSILSWCLIGRELAKLAKRRTIKREGRKLTAYHLAHT